MKKFKALTYAELVIAMAVLGILFVVCIQTIRPKKDNGANFFVAAWDNLMKANEELIYINKKNGNAGLPDDYCSALSDLLSVKSSDCSKGEIVLPSGVKLSGITTNFNSETGVPKTNNIALSAKIGKEEKTYNIRVYKFDGMAVPDAGDNELNEILKFRVISKETGEIVSNTHAGVSFHDAICYMRGVSSQEAPAEVSEEQNDDKPDYSYGINNCGNKVRNTGECPYPASCQIEIVMPKGKTFI